MSVWLALPILSYFAFLFFVSYRTRATDRSDATDYFLAKRNIAPWLAFVSVVATETSVATVIVFPGAGYRSAFQLAWLCAGFIVGRWLVARFYLDKICREHHLSIYSTMSGGEDIARRVLSAFYLLAKFISSGVRFYLGALALNHLFGGYVEIGDPSLSMVFWIMLMAAVAGLYSLIGGMRAVIWTDQLQGYVILIMGIVLVALLLPGADAESFSGEWLLNLDILNASGQTNPLFSPWLFLGAVVLSIGSHGADQDMLQRVLATRDFASARRALTWSGFGATIVICLYLGVGLLLRLNHLEPDGDIPPLVQFVRGAEPGLLGGCFAVLVFAAAMSTLDSAMHSTGAIWKSIFQTSDRSASFSLLSLVLLVCFAVIAIFVRDHFASLLGLAMGSMNYVNGGLIAIATNFAFRRPVRWPATLAALLVGLLMTTVYQSLVGVAWPLVTILSAGGAFIALTCVSVLDPAVSRSPEQG